MDTIVKSMNTIVKSLDSRDSGGSNDRSSRRVTDSRLSNIGDISMMRSDIQTRLVQKEATLFKLRTLNLTTEVSVRNIALRESVSQIAIPVLATKNGSSEVVATYVVNMSDSEVNHVGVLRVPVVKPAVLSGEG